MVFAKYVFANFFIKYSGKRDKRPLTNSLILGSITQYQMHVWEGHTSGSRMCEALGPRIS